MSVLRVVSGFSGLAAELKLLFLSYGSGPHQLEVVFAVHSIRRLHPDAEQFSIVIYTDSPNFFSGLPVKCEYISPALWEEWGGPARFNHRRKILALQSCIEESQSPVLLLDGDTWIRRPLTALESRIAPGRAVMHIQEGQIGSVNSPIYRSLNAMLAPTGEGGSLGIPATAWMWNAGVIGLHPADKGLLTDVLQLTDTLTSMGSLHVLEQFAFSWILQNRLQLSEAADLIFHYWPPHIHKPFRAILPELMQRAALLPPNEQAKFLYAWRPRPTMRRRLRVAVRRVLESLGLLSGYCRSSDWY